MDHTNTKPEDDATSGAGQAWAGVGRPLPEARLLDIGRIRQVRPQPRAWFDPEEQRNLAASISEHGILAPLIVRPDRERPGEYLLIVGERRLRAARSLALAEVPVLIRTGISTDEAFIQALVENLQRADLTPDERYNALKFLEGRGLSQREIGRRLGYDHTTINRQLRIHGDPVLGPAVAATQITATQGQALLGVPPGERTRLIDAIVARRQAGRAIRIGELRDAVKAFGGGAAGAPPDSWADPPLPSIDPSPPPEGPDDDRMRRVIARALALTEHVQQEMAALGEYRRHPSVREEMARARGLIGVALRD